MPFHPPHKEQLLALHQHVRNEPIGFYSETTLDWKFAAPHSRLCFSEKAQTQVGAEKPLIFPGIESEEFRQHFSIKSPALHVLSPICTKEITKQLAPLRTKLHEVQRQLPKSTEQQEWTVCLRQAEFVHSHRDLDCRHDKEELLQLTLNWRLPRKSQRFSLSRCYDGIASAIQALENANVFTREVSRSLHSDNLWPTPSGALPLHWSANALAELCRLFLQGFEADRVVENRSFLNLQEEIATSFSLVEHADENAVDYEGTRRQSRQLFDAGRAKLLACNRKLAELMGVPATGHARNFRGDLLSFWNFELVAAKAVNNPLADLERGLAIETISVQHFNPASGELRLWIEDARLVHQGEIGEGVQPFQWQGNLLSLLEKLDVFGKQSQSLFIADSPHLQGGLKAQVPAAASQPVEIDGSVSCEHYW